MNPTGNRFACNGSFVEGLWTWAMSEGFTNASNDKMYSSYLDALCCTIRFEIFAHHLPFHAPSFYDTLVFSGRNEKTYYMVDTENHHVKRYRSSV